MAIDLSGLTLDNIDIWPVPARVLVIGLVCFMIVALGYWFDTRQQLRRLTEAVAKENNLKSTFETKAGQAANLETYKAQVVAVQKVFQTVVEQLPGRAEIPNLIEDISKVGTTSGLQFELIRPEPEVDKDFYAELPIDIIVTGNYQQLAEFVSGIAALQRIVTLTDFDVSRPEQKPDASGKLVATPANELQMKVTAKTYRYKEGA